ncbi:hypothetical protein GZH47_30275 [Paenibacillus rhizovicinus]|uniref:Uncharacterized protein n=1 Tax=Paenibacillus rhizovicinus TaxID=2704463 RepID=A0A6C0P7Y5_9BACL|nr:hypothetical protein [Paenibacillus rhizovicinus]QHW34658.1 hypothetical protein GZH47_30275 [Paenibacillus rhizovicinus]
MTIGIVLVMTASAIIFRAAAAPSTPVVSKVYNVTSSADYAVSGTVGGLVNFADYIVTGHYVSFQESWNMGEQYWSEVYRFVIEKADFGHVGGTISVAIPHYRQIDTRIDGETYSVHLDLPNDSQPAIGEQYVLFLKQNQRKDSYGPAAVPFQVEINHAKLAELKYNTYSKSKELKTKTNDTIIFSSESIDVAAIDEISGLSEAEFRQQLSAAIASKR